MPAELRVSVWCQLGTDARDSFYLALNGRMLRARYTIEAPGTGSLAWVAKGFFFITLVGPGQPDGAEIKTAEQSEMIIRSCGQPRTGKERTQRLVSQPDRPGHVY